MRVYPSWPFAFCFMPGNRLPYSAPEKGWFFLLFLLFFSCPIYGQGSLSGSYAAAQSSFTSKDKCDTARINALNRVLTDFDPNLPKVNVVPQDIGRVLLNLINNAFQACYTPQSSRNIGTGSQGGESVPTVVVKTAVVKSPSGDLGVEISVKDNGPGIPDAIKDKIFQPFFTTKPTGQGTGLGLSLSYDIVKAHGGELKVKTKVEERNPDNFGKGEGLPAGEAGTEFTITLKL